MCGRTGVRSKRPARGRTDKLEGTPMDPRDRERQERRLIASLPGPDVPPQPLDPETERRLAWFIQNRKRIMEDMALADVAKEKA